MFRVFWRTILNSILLSILLSTAFFVLGSYLLLKLGSSGAVETGKLTENFGLEIATGVARMAGERMAETEDVPLTDMLKDIVQNSTNSQKKLQSNYAIKEIFILDRKGTILAHSEVFNAASGSGVDYKSDPRYTSILKLERKTISIPHRMDILEQVQLNDVDFYQALHKYMPELAMRLRYAFPHQVATRYLYGVPVYRVDEKEASASVHLIMEAKASNTFLVSVQDASLKSVALAFGLLFLINCIMFFALMLTFNGFGRKSARVDKMVQSEKSGMPEIHAAPETGEQTYTRAESKTEILKDPGPDDGPTAAELEIMAEAREREALRMEEHMRSTAQAQSYVSGTGNYSDIDDDEPVLDAIPLENISVQRARRPEYYN